MIIILGSLFESNLLNTPPAEISGIKYSGGPGPVYILKGSKLLHIHEKVAEEYSRALGQTQWEAAFLGIFVVSVVENPDS